jgi:hypothetical protein
MIRQHLIKKTTDNYPVDAGPMNCTVAEFAKVHPKRHPTALHLDQHHSDLCPAPGPAAAPAILQVRLTFFAQKPVTLVGMGIEGLFQPRSKSHGERSQEAPPTSKPGRDYEPTLFCHTQLPQLSASE